MAVYGPLVGGVTRDDILQSKQKIIQESTRDYEESIDSRHIGSRFNQWRKPVADYGNNPAGWEVKIKSSQYVGDIEFSKKQWSLARSVVDGVLDLLLKEIQALSSSYEGLKVERYVRQGSAREGLKIIAPDEFDTILQFHFEGLSFEIVLIKKNGSIVPEFCYLEVNQSMEVLQRRLPKLCRDGVFYYDGTRVLINARMMHERVFKSIIDKASDNIMSKINESSRSEEQVFKLTRKINPPSINITIHLNNKVIGHFMPHDTIANTQSTITEIDIDIVPGLVIRNDQVPDPSYPGQTMDCPVYAVFKWVEESSMKASDFPKPDIVWRISSSGIEKHTLDLVRSDRKQLYIITAMRMIKTYFVKTKKASRTPPQICTVLKSYHLKHIAFYLIMYTCYIYPDAKVDGVVDALRFFFTFLTESLERKSLPHFFHSNPHIRRMYSTYQYRTDQLRFNLLRNKSDEALHQAVLSLDNNMLPDFGFGDKGYENARFYAIKREYSDRISIEIVWRISSSGVEKHTLDLVRSDRKQLYIITAMRMIKTYFVKTKKASRTPPQIATVLRSYHLKHIAFYLILYTCYIHPDAKIFGVADALRYFFAFLRESLEKKRLPHFFHSNPHINKMYPSYKPLTNQLRFNLLRNKSDEALNQAKLSLDNHLLPDLRFDGQPAEAYDWLSDDEYGEPSNVGFGGARSSGNRGTDDIDTKLDNIKREYSHGISIGMFF